MSTTPRRSTRRSRTANAWDIEPEVRPAQAHSIPVVLGFAALAFPGLFPPGPGLPVSEYGGVLLAGMTLLSAPVERGRLARWVLPLFLGIVLLLVASGLANDALNWRRMVHVLDWGLIMIGLGTGRLPARSAGRGLVLGIAAAMVISIAGINSVSTGGRLTGAFGDPNVAGYYLTVLGAVALAFLARRRARQVGLGGLILVGVYQSLSRTSLLAAAIGLAWVAVGRRLGRVGGMLTVVLIVYVIDNIPDQLRLFGPFAERAGSDALRDRIIAAEVDQLAGAPWYGYGPGTAQVLVDDRPFFFHNSYLAARNEGGWLLVVLICAMIALAFLGLFNQHIKRDEQTWWCQAALITLVVSAINLGEVLLELPAAVAIGMALAQRHRWVTEAVIPPPDEPEPEPEPAPPLPRGRRPRTP